MAAEPREGSPGGGAPYGRRAGRGSSVWYMGCLFTVLAASGDTGGRGGGPGAVSAQGGGGAAGPRVRLGGRRGGWRGVPGLPGHGAGRLGGHRRALRAAGDGRTEGARALAPPAPPRRRGLLPPRRPRPPPAARGGPRR